MLEADSDAGLKQSPLGEVLGILCTQPDNGLLLFRQMAYSSLSCSVIFVLTIGYILYITR